MHKETGFHNKLMNTYDIVSNTVIPYASIASLAKDDKNLVNLKNLQCDLAYADELKQESNQRQLAIHIELLITFITCLRLIIDIKTNLSYTNK